jgi:hypothetical protein
MLAHKTLFAIKKKVLMQIYYSFDVKSTHVARY